MFRLTKKIKNTYCEYEVKNAKYKQLFDLKSNKQIENYVNCDLSIAIDKLGRLEDVEDELGCPIEVLVKALKQKCIYCEKAYNFDNDEEFDELNHTMECSFKLRFFTISENVRIDILNMQENLKDYVDKWCFEFQFDTDGDNFSAWEWDYYLVKLADYKKTWWLKNDKSE